MINRAHEAGMAMDSPPRLEHIVDGKRAWVRADLQREDWLFRLPPACLAELKALLPQLAGHLTPVENIDPAQFDLPACRAFMRRVKQVLDEGVRFALIDRLPIDELGDEVAHAHLPRLDVRSVDVVQVVGRLDAAEGRQRDLDVGAQAHELNHAGIPVQGVVDLVCNVHGHGDRVLS